MSDLSLQLVREFFELSQFHVLTLWRPEEEGRDAAPLLLVQQPESSFGNAAPVEAPKTSAPFLLSAEDISLIPRAVIDVRAWHADRFYPSVIENNPVLLTATLPRVHEMAARMAGAVALRSVLVISELPQNAEPRRRSLELLAHHGLHHVMEFGSILQALIRRIQPGAAYAPSATLQTIRLLKRYGFISNQQLEFQFRGEERP